MSDKYRIKRGVSPENFVHNLKAIWHTSPGMRIRFYLSIALGVLSILWFSGTALLEALGVI